MSATGDFFVRFWGVRGSLACPGPETVRYGGNTSCLEVRCGPHLLIFDAGTGLRPLGDALMREEPVDADLFFSHTHLDHIVGLPFFKPIYSHRNTIRLWAGHLLPEHSLKDVVRSMMKAPLFPVPIDLFNSGPSFNDFRCGDRLEPKPGVSIVTGRLSHPDRATGYRIEYADKSICYVTDTEHRANELDANILALVEGADLFIYDCTYTDEEYPCFVGWGHSTWQQGVRLSEAAGVKTLVAFHHDPSHDDAFMDGIAAAAEKMRPGTLVAREGLVLRP